LGVELASDNQEAVRMEDLIWKNFILMKNYLILHIRRKISII
jgi:hypothetical protein